MSSIPSPTIRRIDAAACLPLRREVLWPALSLAECAVAEDALGSHYGADVDGRLVCVASFFLLDDDAARLRKFATAAAWQRHGIGTGLLRQACAELADLGVSRLWFDARVGAQAYYRRLGFTAQGANFIKQGLDYVRMVGTLAELAWPAPTT